MTILDEMIDIQNQVSPPVVQEPTTPTPVVNTAHTNPQGENIFQKFRNIFGSTNKKKVIGIGILLIILAAIPGSIYLSQQNQDIRQRASEGEKITYATQTFLNGAGDKIYFRRCRLDSASPSYINHPCEPVDGTYSVIATPERAYRSYSIFNIGNGKVIQYFMSKEGDGNLVYWRRCAINETSSSGTTLSCDAPNTNPVGSFNTIGTPDKISDGHARSYTILRAPGGHAIQTYLSNDGFNIYIRSCTFNADVANQSGVDRPCDDYRGPFPVPSGGPYRSYTLLSTDDGHVVQQFVGGTDGRTEYYRLCSLSNDESGINKCGNMQTAPIGPNGEEAGSYDVIVFQGPAPTQPVLAKPSDTPVPTKTPRTQTTVGTPSNLSIKCGESTAELSWTAAPNAITDYTVIYNGHLYTSPASTATTITYSLPLDNNARVNASLGILPVGTTNFLNGAINCPLTPGTPTNLQISCSATTARLTWEPGPNTLDTTEYQIIYNGQTYTKPGTYTHPVFYDLTLDPNARINTSVRIQPNGTKNVVAGIISCPLPTNIPIPTNPPAGFCNTDSQCTSGSQCINHACVAPTTAPVAPTTAPTTAQTVQQPANSTAAPCTRTQGGYKGTCIASATISDDLTFWKQEVQKASPNLNADYNGDGTVNTLDFNLWAQKRYP